MPAPPHNVPGRGLPEEELISTNRTASFTYKEDCKKYYRGNGTWGGSPRQRILFSDATEDLTRIEKHFNKEAHYTRLFMGKRRSRFVVHDRWLVATDPTDLRSCTLPSDWFTDATTAKKRILTQLLQRKFRTTG